MLTYCLKPQKIQRIEIQKMLETKNGRLMLSAKCAICGSTKSRFAKEQKAKGLLSNLGLKTPLIKIAILADILF